MDTSLEPAVRRLWLVRHGETTWNREKRFCGHQDVALSPLGEAQAQWVGEQLCGRPVVALYTSDLQRAQQTTKIIARNCSAPLVIKSSPAWRELSFGAWEGLTYPQIVGRFPNQLDFFTDPMQVSPPDGESLATLLQRVQTAFAQLTQDALSLPPGDMVLVSHQGPLRVLVCRMLSISLDHHWQLRFDHGSLSAFDFLAGAEDVASTTTLSLLNQHAIETMLQL
jgi:broad specificity phosphatase PhoE